jgi:hypothetical protein
VERVLRYRAKGKAHTEDQREATITMKLLTTSFDLTKSFRDAMRRYQRYRFCVAWASWNFPLYDELLKRQDRISQLVVGTHFYQTHPNFLQAFIDHPAARFVFQPRGIFHPKIYLFENNPDDWACIIGSPNFTGAAFSSNLEAAVLFDSKVPDARSIYDRLSNMIEEQWRNGEKLTRPRLDRYQSIWDLQRPRLQNLAGTFGNTTTGKALVDIELFGLSWPEFVSRVKSEKHHSLPDRLRVLKAVRGYFANNKRFGEMDPEQRRRIAGVAPPEVSPDGRWDWGYFGHMKGAGRFWRAVNRNDQSLSAALDCIPLDGLVAEDHYRAFVEFFQKAFPKGGGGIAVATRLLCMKRPDMFVCLDSKNRTALCKEFGITWANMDDERYWREVIERVRLMKWWNEPRPVEDEEIWLGRTALLDALYYEP